MFLQLGYKIENLYKLLGIIALCKSKKLFKYTWELNPLPLALKANALPNELVCKFFQLGHKAINFQ